jgi:transcriptional regulator with PAS, ATPase and Fis domain
MARVLEPLLRVAATSANVLITGESGTGKELVARSVHTHSDRSGPFVPIDCAALPEHLLESELFGHERGAFTGAVQQKVGLMIRASKGTLFLDEIGEMSQGLQAKLLRVLEERLVRPVGSTREIPIDVRLVAATNVDLEAAVDDGTFRVDLFYRLNVVRLEVPPLRNRPEDIPLLLMHFLDEFARASNKELPRVAPEAWEPIERYAWPGNVRELRNLAQRLVVFDADARITTSDLPAEIRGTETPVEDATPFDVPYEEARDAALRAFRKSYLRDLLDRTAGNVSQAARAAGVSRRTVHRWMIEDEE